MHNSNYDTTAIINLQWQLYEPERNEQTLSVCVEYLHRIHLTECTVEC